MTTNEIQETIKNFNPGSNVLFLTSADLTPGEEFSVNYYITYGPGNIPLHPVTEDIDSPSADDAHFQGAIVSTSADGNLVITDRYLPREYTLRECSGSDASELIFEATDGKPLGKPNGSGVERDDFMGSVKRLAAMYHLWITKKVNKGDNYPTAFLVDITDANRWVGKF